ncbi:MAG: OB-fold nucleic acid binding domain-containing protein [Acidobacteriota bacterium]|nr:OB-fold nucleic acid binding domain-containing protein [Acidobacteriota bacterium]
MKQIKAVILTAALLFTGLTALQAFAQEKIIPFEKAGDYVGQTVTVAGVIVSSYNSGRACFLNFDPDYQHYLSLVIFASDFNRFPPQPEKYYLNKKVRVRGRIMLYKGRPEIILSSPDQIKIVEEAGEEQAQTVAIDGQRIAAAGGKAEAEEKAAARLQSSDKPEKEISWEEAADYYGQTVRVRGKVVAANNTGKVCFLNFHRNWKRYFTVVIFASSFSRFPESPEKLYLNKDIRVYGRIKEYQGKPEIIVDSPEQIEIIK